MAEAWAPTLAEVANRIPTRTRDTTTPGSDTLLGTFTADTTPNADQAGEAIDSAVGAVVDAVGALPDRPGVQRAARDAACWRAAADIELAYPIRDADVRVAGLLDARAKDALKTLQAALEIDEGGTVEDFPQWAFPDPVPWGDWPLY
jgi:hypothetical protein